MINFRQLSTFSMAVVLFLSSCVNGFYKHVPNKPRIERSIASSSQRDWQLMSTYNDMVVHVGEQMYLMSRVVYTSENDSISARISEFTGLPRLHYDKIMNDKDGIAYKEKGADVRDLKQIHLFVNQLTLINDNQIRFARKDIYQADVTEQAVLLNALANFGIVSVTVIGGFAAFLAIVCNCPRVYLDDPNGNAILNNSLFTGAIAPQLERTDFARIHDYYPSSPTLAMNIVNEEEEDHYINQLSLAAVLHEKELKIALDANGNVHAFNVTYPPVSMEDNDGKVETGLVASNDFHSYNFTPSTMSDFVTLDVVFHTASLSQENLALVLTAKNTLWSGYVYDQFSSLFGKNHQKWVTKNKNKSKEEREQWKDEQGIPLHVEFWNGNAWQALQRVELIGDKNYERLVIPIPQGVNEEQLKIRLRSGYHFWEVDEVVITTLEKTGYSVTTHEASKAISVEKAIDVRAELRADDGNYVSSEASPTSTRLFVEFGDLPVSDGLSRSLFLQSKGYYISKKNYEGKTQRERLSAFKKQGELSRYSKQLFDELTKSISKQ